MVMVIKSRTTKDREPPPGFHPSVPKMRNKIIRKGISVVQAKILKEKSDISVEVIDLQTIRPLDKNTVIDSVKKTNRLVTVEESWPFASVGSEIVSIVQKDAFDYLDAPIIKINSADVPMPYSSVLEKQYLPQVDDIIKAIEEVCYI